MKKLTLITSALILWAFQIQAQDIILIHTNDLHSKINGYSPEREYTPLKQDKDLTIGGFSRIAQLIKQEKESHPDDIVLVVDAGDFLMGSLFHTLEKQTGFQLSLMQDMGFDYVALGNHEFDYGPEALAEIINQAKNKGEIPQLLLTNVKFDPKDPRDDELEKLYNEGFIKKYIIHEEKGRRIAFLGIMGYDAEDVQPFLPPVKITDPVKKTSRYLIKNKLADAVIVLSHSGVIQKKGRWTGEDVKIAKKASPFIHAVISGHTHTKLEAPIIEKNIPIVQTGSGGQYVGRLVLEKTEKGFKMKNHELISIDDNIQGLPQIQEKIKEQEKLIQKEILTPLNMEYDKPVCEVNFNMECDEFGNLKTSTLGPFLAEAIQYYTESAGYHSDISLTAAGVIRDQLRKGNEGKQNVADIFRILSLGEGKDSIPGYALAQIYLTGKEIKSVLEVLLKTQADYTAAYSFFSGIRITVDMDKGFLKKIQKIEIGNDKKGWAELDYSKKNKQLYAVTANSYVLSFLGMIKQKSFGLINVKPKDKNGNPIKDMSNQNLDFDKEKPGLQEGKEWLAFYYFAKTFPDTNGNNIPDIPQVYKTKYNPVIFLNQ